MSPSDKLGFAISDRIDDIEVGPQHVPLALLGEFQRDVADFLRGSDRDVDPAKVQISIESGSLSLIASGLLAATTLWGDLHSLENSRSLGLIDSKRASVLARWQSSARQHPNRQYMVFNKSSGEVLLSVDKASDLKSAEDVWVHVEKYLHGKVIDMGGKTKANVHLELENGQTMTISSTQELLAEGDRNRLYREELLHVAAEENLMTGELRNARLIGFETYHPRYDEDEFKRMVERGTKAWKDMPDSWLEDLRGGEA